MTFIVGGINKKGTIKLNKVEKDFVAEVVRTGDRFEAAEIVTGDRSKARELLARDNVQEAIVSVLDANGITDTFLAGKLKMIINAPLKPTKIYADEVLRAIEMVYNLKGTFAAKKVDITAKNANIQMLMSMNESELQNILMEIVKDGAGNNFPKIGSTKTKSD